jgi:hypothetical protein
VLQAVPPLGLLQLMAAMQQVSRPHYPWPPAAEAALRQLASVLKEGGRQARLEAEGSCVEDQQGQQQAREGRADAKSEAGIEAEGEGGLLLRQRDQGAAAEAGPLAAREAAEGQTEEGAVDEGEKLRAPAGQQARLLAARRAAQLQPACLKLLKDLLQKQGAAGKRD